MDSAFKYFSRKKLHLAHGLVLVLLSGISIYSTYSVVYTYLFGNTSTSTSIKTCDNILPFAKYLTVYYRFNDYTLFPETWKLNASGLSELLPEYYEEPGVWPLPSRIERRESEKILHSEYFQGGDISLENMIDVASVAGVISRLDYEFLAAVSPDDTFALPDNMFPKADVVKAFFLNLSTGLTAHADDTFRSIPSGPIKQEVTTVVDRFIENEYADALVDKTISHILGPKPVRVLSAAFANTSSYVPLTLFVDRLSPRSLEISIPLDFMGDVPTETLTFAILPFDQRSTPPSFSNLYYLFTPYAAPVSFASTTLPLDFGLSDPILLSTLTFQNSAVYTSTGVRSESDCRICENLTRIELCKFKCVLNSVVDLCRCVPFAYRRLYYSDLQRNKLPRCSMKRYNTCLQSALEYNVGQCAGEKVVPCVTKQNTDDLRTHGVETVDELEMLIKIDDQNYFYTDRTYRHYISIIFPQKTYVLFEDKFENTWMQMMGEVGGNLGLFLSFSLHGLWQVAVFFYTAYERRRPAASPGISGTATAWLRLAQLNIETDTAIRTVGSAPMEHHQLKDILSRIRDHGTKFDDILSEKKMMEKRLRALEMDTGNSDA